jgi:hypothetical protein
LADRITGAYAVKRLAEQRLASAGFKDLDALERKMGELPAIDRPKILTSAMRTDPALAARVQSLIEAAGVTKDQVKHAINRLEAQVMLEQFRPQWLALKPS